MKSTKLKLVVAAIVLLALLPALARAQGITPTVVSYQGRVTVGGQPFDGIGYFKFALVDSFGNTTWSNDGTSVGGGEPASAVVLTVTDGLFNVLLGDPILLMPALDRFAFLDPLTSLRVWFSPDGAAFTQLVPDRPIATVPYAFNADDADTVDGQHAADFAAANHDHWGETWSGNGTGLELNSSDGVGLYGRQGASAGVPPIAGAGVWGDSVEHPGVWGTSRDAAGVVGFTSHNVGVAGLSNSDDGIGVQGSAPVTGTVGIATNSSGPTWGVYGKSDAPNGYGVYGENMSGGTTYGVYGKNNSDSGAGVYGVSANTAGVGVRGETVSGHGIEGVVDWTKHGTGVGVYGSGGFYGNAAVFENMTTDIPTVLINNLNANAGAPALIVTGTTRLEQGGVQIIETDLSGIVIEDAGGADDHVRPEEVWPYAQTDDGIDIYGAADHGIFIGHAGRSGIEIYHVDAHGLEVWDAGGSGVQVLHADVNGGYFEGQQSGVAAETTESDQEWGVFTYDKIYAGAGYTSGGSMMLVAKNGDDGNLETGDVVAVAGMAFAPGESQNPIPLVQRASKGSVTAVIGVVYRRFVFETHVESFRREGKVKQRTSISTNSADGAIAPGDYLLIVVLGPAQVKVDASSTAIHAGDLLTASATGGRAMKAEPVKVGGVEFYPPGGIIGKAMEELDKGEGLIWAMVTLQ